MAAKARDSSFHQLPTCRKPASTSRKLFRPASRFSMISSGDVVGLRQVIQVRQALVLEPEDIEAGLVARADFLIAVAAPTGLPGWPSRPKSPCACAGSAGCSS